MSDMVILIPAIPPTNSLGPFSMPPLAPSSPPSPSWASFDPRRMRATVLLPSVLRDEWFLPCVLRGGVTTKKRMDGPASRNEVDFAIDVNLVT